MVESRCIRCLVNGFVRSEANGQMPQYLMPHLLRYREEIYPVNTAYLKRGKRMLIVSEFGWQHVDNKSDVP